MTKQSFKKACDVNNIVNTYIKTGTLGHVNPKQPFYGDVSNVVDYRDMCEKISRIDGLFDALPAQVRSRFMNDPAMLVDFLNDEKNIVEAIELGIVDRPPAAPLVPATAAGGPGKVEAKNDKV
jgi:phage internal scaffolding protein